MMRQNNKLLGATPILAAYHAQTFDSLQSQFIGFDDLSIIAKIYHDNAHLCDESDTTIFNAVQLQHYESQCFDNLYQHLRYLQLEFIGQSELLFYHTLLIVLLRRGYQPEQTFTLFELLWQTHNGYFFEKLSLRWLVSAADTFIDFSPSPVRRAILMNVTSLINTLKAYETQQYVSLGHGIVDDKKIRSLREKHRQLYDGLTFLRLGSDDTIEQMRRRFLSFAQDDGFATQFLLKIFDRLHDNPTAYAFFKQMHTEDWGYRWSYPFKKGEK